MSYDPFNPPPVLERFAALKELRAQGRVVEVSPGFFYLPHHEDIVEVSKDFETFEQGGFSADEHMAEGDHVALGGTNPPPRHTVARKAMSRIFTSSKIRSYEPMVRDVCAELLQPLRGRDRFDVCGDFGLIANEGVVGV